MAHFTKISKLQGPICNKLRREGSGAIKNIIGSLILDDMHMPNDLSMKSLFESFDFHEKQHLNTKEIIPGTFLHKSHAFMADDSKGMDKLWT